MKLFHSTPLSVRRPLTRRRRLLVPAALTAILVLIGAMAVTSNPVQLHTKLTAQTDDPATNPACASTSPSLPASEYPGDGNQGDGYGVPFVAQISNGQLLAGFDEQIAYFDYTKSASYDPWIVTLSNIYGWLTGWIQVPSYRITVAQLYICDVPQQGNDGFTPPAGMVELLQQTILVQPGTSSVFSGTPLFYNHEFSIDKNGKTEKFTNPQPINVSITPAGPIQLGIADVQSNGAIDLSGSIGANVTVANSGSFPFVCTSDGDTLGITTTAPPLKSAAPYAGATKFENPTTLSTEAPSNYMQAFPSAPLTGPIRGSSAQIVDSQLQISNFDVSNPACNVAVLNNGLAGDDINGNTNGTYQQGWAQFGAQTTITQIGLPVQAAPTGSPADCAASNAGPPASPYEFQFSASTSGAGGSLLAGAASASGLKATTCGYLKIVPGPGSCPQTELYVPADGTNFANSNATLAVIPNLPTSAPLTLNTGAITGTVACGGSSSGGLTITANANPVASTGLFGLSCKIEPSVTLTGTATGPFNNISVTLGSNNFTVPAVTLDPVACPGSLPGGINQILGLPLKPGVASLSVPLSASISLP